MPWDPEAVAAALPGYDIGAELGHGAWGVVIAGRQRQLGRDVAIKQLPPAFGADPAVRNRFMTEARLLASLDHPHIVPIFDFVEHEGLCLLIMEYLPGGTVWSRAKGQGLSPQAACAVVIAACSGLHYAHQRGVLHRDVKPENLVFSADDVLKVTDFGIAKVVGGAATMATRAGYVLGTPAYIAPEQALSEELTPATDVYAAGTVLYELLSGQLPFPEASDPIVAIYQHVHSEPRPLREVAAHVPESLSDVTSRAVAREPADRFASAEEFGAAIVEAAIAAWGPRWSAGSGITLRGTESMLERITGDVPRVPSPAPQSREKRREAATVMAPATRAESTAAALPAGPGDLVPLKEMLPPDPDAKERRRPPVKLVALTLVPVLLVGAIATYLIASRHSTVGTGPAGVSVPEAITTDPKGDLFVLDTHRNEVIEKTLDGRFVVFAGNGVGGQAGDEGPARLAELDAPSSLASDGAGNIYIGSYDDGRVRKVTLDGLIHTVAGSDTNPDATADLAVSSSGVIFLAGQHNHKVLELANGSLKTVAGTGAQGTTGDGGPAANAELDTPSGVAVDGAGNVYIADGPSARIRRFHPGGVITTFAGGGSSGDGGPATSAGLSYPFGVAVDHGGDVFIADVGAQNVREVEANGTIITFAGNGKTGFSGDGGQATAAEFHNCGRVAVGVADDVYVDDYFNHRIRRVAVDGRIWTVA